MKTYEQINDRIESGKAVLTTADEIMDYVDKKGVEAAATRWTWSLPAPSVRCARPGAS